MHNREPLTPALLWQSVKDFDLWPIYILGLTFQTPMSTVRYSRTKLILREVKSYEPSFVTNAIEPTSEVGPSRINSRIIAIPKMAPRRFTLL